MTEPAQRIDRRRIGFGYLAIALAFAGGVVTQFPQSRPTASFPTLPAAMEQGDSRLDIVGPEVSKAGGTVITLKSERATYRQTCKGGCDHLLVNFDAIGEGLYRLGVLAPGGAPIFSQDAYVDGHSWNRLSAGAGGKLALRSDLVAQPPYGERVRPKPR